MNKPEIERHCGEITLVVRAVDDDSPDTSDLGEFTTLKRATEYYPVWRDNPTYSTQNDAVRLPKTDLWRNRKGQIVAAPEENPYSRNYQFIKLPTDCDSLRICFALADRFIGLNRYDWCYVGIVANVYYKGKEVGHASCWGYESDDPELRTYYREQAHQALADARTFIRSLQAPRA